MNKHYLSELKLVIFLAGAVLISMPAEADLIESTEYTTDTVTELDWLKLNILVGFTYDEVAAGALGYTTNGWRYATKEEIVSLFERYIGAQNSGYSNWPPGEPNGLAAEYFLGAEELVEKLGMNFAFNDSRAAVDSTTFPGLHVIIVQGMVNDGSDADPRQGFAEGTAVIADLNGVYADDAPFGRWGVVSDFVPTNQGSPTRSSFLVRDARFEQVSIDIKPGSDPNCFNQNGHGAIPVAVLGSAEFDVSQIDTSSLFFGGLEVRVRGNSNPMCSLTDINDDGTWDLVCQFEDDSNLWAPGDGEATLSGKLLDGTDFEGTDSICIVP